MAHPCACFARCRWRRYSWRYFDGSQRCRLLRKETKVFWIYQFNGTCFSIFQSTHMTVGTCNSRRSSYGRCICATSIMEMVLFHQLAVSSTAEIHLTAQSRWVCDYRSCRVSQTQSCRTSQILGSFADI